MQLNLGIAKMMYMHIPDLIIYYLPVIDRECIIQSYADTCHFNHFCLNSTIELHCIKTSDIFFRPLSVICCLIFRSVEDNGNYWNNVFATPWCRVPAYMIGMILAIAINRVKDQQKKMNKVYIYTSLLSTSPPQTTNQPSHREHQKCSPAVRSGWIEAVKIVKILRHSSLLYLLFYINLLLYKATTLCVLIVTITLNLQLSCS